LDTLRTSQAWASALESSRAAQHPTTSSSTQPPAAAQTVQRLDTLLPKNPLAPTSPDSIRPSSVSDAPPSQGSTPSVAELLSQLRSSQGPEPTYDSAAERPTDRTIERPYPSSGPSGHGHGHANTSRTPTPAPQTTCAHPSEQQPAQDIRALSFQQALPHISRLMEDPHVVESLSKVTSACSLSCPCLHFISAPILVLER
jgi:hypothetical protein